MPLTHTIDQFHRQDAPAVRHRWLKLATFAAFHLSCTLAMLALLACTPEPGGRLAVVFPPWYGSGQVLSAIVRADGRLVRLGNVPWIAIIAPSAHHRIVQQRLASQGALAFINPIIVGGCETATPLPLSVR